MKRIAQTHAIFPNSLAPSLLITTKTSYAVNNTGQEAVLTLVNVPNFGISQDFMSSFGLNRYLITSVFFCALGHAFMIGDLAEENLLPQSCRITLEGKPVIEKEVIRTPITLCSGTIIGKAQILTAAHCLVAKDFEKGTIQCPGDEPKTIKQWTYPKDYGSDKSQVNNDIGLIQIHEQFKAEAARLPLKPSDLVELLESAESGKELDCRIFGYGLDARGQSGTHAGRKVHFHAWLRGQKIQQTINSVTQEVIKETRTDILKRFNEDNLTLLIEAESTIDGVTVDAIRSGDSGGGLLCTDGIHRPILLSVTSGSTRATRDGKNRHAGLVVSVAHQLKLISQLLEPNPNTSVTGAPRNPQFQKPKARLNENSLNKARVNRESH